MNVLLFGAAGFSGTNLALKLKKDPAVRLTLVDVNRDYFPAVVCTPDITLKESAIGLDVDFASLFQGQDIVYHLVSTTVPTTSNQQIADELSANVVMTAKLLDSIFYAIF